MSFSYQTTTLSELVSELDTLGGSSRVKMNPSHLTARVTNNPRLSHYAAEMKDYIIWQNSKKKFYYDRVTQNIDQSTIREALQYFAEGFNVTIVVYGNILEEILKIIYKGNYFAINHFLYPMDPTSAIISLIQQQTKAKSPFYQWNKHIKIEQKKSQTTLTKIVFLKDSSSELRIVCLPSKVFEESSHCKGQLFQLLDGLKQNSQKSGKQVANRMFMKKHKITGMFIDNVLDDNLNYIVHDCLKTNGTIFEFFDKFRGLCNFSMKGSSLETTVIKVPIRHLNTPSTKSIEVDEMQYCRKLERKTHKFSIAPLKYQTILSEEQIQTKKRIFLSVEEQLQVMKSQHIVQISKYHQTIQSLNSKLLILQKEHSIEQLCSVYQKQMMLLELKIQQLRGQISNICKDSKDELKLTIKTLNQQLKQIEKERKTYENPNHIHKDKKLEQLQNSLKQSEMARNKILEELKSSNNRLTSREKEIKDLNIQLSKLSELGPISNSTLSVSTQQQAYQLNNLLNQLSKGNGQSFIFIKNRVSHLFLDLQSSKKLVTQCTSFLVELQKQLELKIQNIDRNIVLDCNRFIRSFILKCIQTKE